MKSENIHVEMEEEEIMHLDGGAWNSVSNVALAKLLKTNAGSSLGNMIAKGKYRVDVRKNNGIVQGEIL